jgi:hypothetical protein
MALSIIEPASERSRSGISGAVMVASTAVIAPMWGG